MAMPLCVFCVLCVCVLVCVCWCWCVTLTLPLPLLSPCVRSRRARVYRHHARECYHRRVPPHTVKFFECTHGGFQRATPHRTHTPRPRRHTQLNAARTHIITRRQGQRETDRDTETDRERERRQRERQDKTRKEKTRQEGKRR